MHRKAAQGNGYADDEQKLKAINHFDLFCSFFRLKLILMPSVARQRGCPGAAQESVKKRERKSERGTERETLLLLLYGL